MGQAKRSAGRGASKAATRLITEPQRVPMPDAAMLHLAESGLYLDDVERQGLYFEIQPGDGTKALLQFPYRREVRQVPFVRGRVFRQDVDGAWEAAQEGARYLQDKGTGAWLYLPVSAWDWEVVRADDTWDLWLTEGEKKAIKACKEGLPCVSVPGVSSWREKGGWMQRELEAFVWKGRRVVLAFDADIRFNDQAREDVEGLGLALMNLGAHVVQVDLEALGGRHAKLDDVLVSHGVAEVVGLLDTARPPVHPEVVRLDAEVVHIRNAGSVWVRRTGAEVPLSVARGSVFADRPEVSKKRGGQGAFDGWLHWPGHSAVDALEIFTGQGETVAENGTTYLNAWQGWATEPVRGRTPRWQELLRSACGSVEGARHLERWVAWRVQRGTRPLTAVLLIGEQGTGKGLVCEVLRDAVFGPTISAAINPTTIERDQRYGWVAGKALVYVMDTEGGAQLRRSNVGGLLKPVITDPVVWEDPKYLQARQRRNCAQLIVCSNHLDEIQIEPGDRRWTVLESTRKLNPTDQWVQELRAEYPAILHRLMHLQLGDFGVTTTLDTAAKVEATGITAKPEVVWLEALRDGELAEGDEPVFGVIRPAELYEACAQWRRKHGVRGYHNLKSFMREVRKVFGDREMKIRSRKLGITKPITVFVIDPGMPLQKSRVVDRRVGDMRKAGMFVPPGVGGE